MIFLDESRGWVEQTFVMVPWTGYKEGIHMAEGQKGKITVNQPTHNQQSKGPVVNLFSNPGRDLNEYSLLNTFWIINIRLKNENIQNIIVTVFPHPLYTNGTIDISQYENQGWVFGTVQWHMAESTERDYMQKIRNLQGNKYKLYVRKLHKGLRFRCWKMVPSVKIKAALNRTGNCFKVKHFQWRKL